MTSNKQHIENKYLSYFEQARKAQGEMLRLSNDTIQQVLIELAETLVAHTDQLLEANQRDLLRMPESDPKYDRLKLTGQRIQDIAGDLRQVAALPSPTGEVLESRTLPNGLDLKKVSVPLGVIGVIYEARPNVTVDVFSLCFKTGNVTVLKGGSDAEHSNLAIIQLIHDLLRKRNIDPAVAILLPTERAAAEALLQAEGYVDVLIPRGSQQLIQYVRSTSRIPVIETGAGIVHTYFDASGSTDKGAEIIQNAKTRKVSACNALDSLLVHQTRLQDLPSLIQPLAADQVTLYADEASYEVLKNHYPSAQLEKAGTDSFGTEFLSLKLSIKTVSSLEEAIQHIGQYSSKHSEAIIAEDEQAIEQFLNQVDAAAVYANASTAFTDGAQFGLGAEIGISTQKLHARGPMGLAELTSYKWLVRGNGQVRN